MMQKNIEKKAKRIARKKVKEFLESEQLMTIQKEEKPERKMSMEDLFGEETPKQKDNEEEMTFEKDYVTDKMEALKKLLYDTKPTNPKPIEMADEGTGLEADMTFAKEENEDRKKSLDELFNTDINKIEVDDVDYNTISAEDFASILGENKKFLKFLEEDELDDEEEELPEPEETEKDEEEPEENISGLVISDDMLDELIDRILDKFDEMGLVVISTDDEDLDKLSDEIENKLKDKVNVLSDEEFEEAISYQVNKSLSSYKRLNESLLKRRWENFIREIENGKMEPAKVGTVKESRSKKMNSKLRDFSFNTKISKNNEININPIMEDKTIKLLLDDEF